MPTKKYFYLLLINYLNIALYTANENIISRILGGYQMPSEAVPFFAQIAFSNEVKCGGSIMSKHWIITAAHCYDSEENYTYSIFVGSEILEMGSQYFIKDIIIHPKYDGETENDIALFYTEKSIRFSSRVQMVAFPPPTFPGTAAEEYTGRVATVFGFGITHENETKMSNYLRAAQVRVVSNSYCWDHQIAPILSMHICAKGEKNRDACDGDSGGPLVIDNNVLIGIVAWGDGCGGESPGVYTRVSEYIDWIHQNAKK